jgi:hypothetical protein
VVTLQLFTGATEEYDGTTWTTSGNLEYSKIAFSRNWNTNSRFSFWWSIHPSNTDSTEEYDGSYLDN